MLWLRSLLWTLLLPGVVVGYVPWAVFGLDRLGWEWSLDFLAGAVVVAAGLAHFAPCIFGSPPTERGTLPPFIPPRHLLFRGLSLYLRNPIR